MLAARRRPHGFQGMPSAIWQSGPHPTPYHLVPNGNAQASHGLPTSAQKVGSECLGHLAMDFGGVGATQQGLTDSCLSGGVNTAVQNLALHAPVAAAAPWAIGPYKYTSSVHSLHPGIPSLQASCPAKVQPAVHIQGQESLTTSMLATASFQEQKQMLGECLFPLIQTMHLNLAGKITGMLLEMDHSEQLHALESPESLRSKVDEAGVVL